MINKVYKLIIVKLANKMFHTVHVIGLMRYTNNNLTKLRFYIEHFIDNTIDNESMTKLIISYDVQMMLRMMDHHLDEKKAQNSKVVFCCVKRLANMTYSQLVRAKARELLVD